MCHPPSSVAPLTLVEASSGSMVPPGGPVVWPGGSELWGEGGGSVRGLLGGWVEGQLRRLGGSWGGDQGAAGWVRGQLGG